MVEERATNNITSMAERNLLNFLRLTPTPPRQSLFATPVASCTSDPMVAHKKNASKLFRTSKSNSLIRDKLFLTMEGG
jgi:hypothetical protein